MSAEIQLEWYIDPVAPSVIAPRVHGLTYNGSAQSAVAIPGSAEGGTMWYSLSANGPWTISSPTVTNAGSYTLYYYVKGDDNHTDLPPAGLSFRVAAAAPDVTPPTARSITYSGIAQYLINAGSSSSGTTMLYRLGEDGEWSTTRPQGTYADDYTVYWKVDGGDNYGDVDGGAIVVTIGRRALTVTAKDQTITYGESIKQGAAYAITSGLATGDSLTSVVLTQSTTSVTDSGAITPSAAIISKSSTDVTINYTVTYADGVLVINKTAASVTAAPTARSLTYSGSAQTLIYTGAASGGTMWYRLGTSGEWSTALPTYTNASSSLTVYYYVKGDSNHSDSETASITASIVKRPLTVTAKAQTITYGESIATGTDQVTVNGLVSGHSLSSITLSQSTTNVPGGTITPSAAVIRDGNSVTVTNNYAITYATGKLTINKAPSTITLSAYTVSVYPGSMETITATFTGSPGTRNVTTSNSSYATATLTGNTITVNGVAVGNATITVSVEGSDNYEPASATIAVSVVTLPFVEATAAGYSGVYDNAAHGITVSVTKPASGYTIYYSTDNSTWTTTKPTYTNVVDTPKTVYWKVTASGYQDATGSATVNITKATPTLVLNPTSLTIGKKEATGTIAITYGGDGTLSASSSSTSLATASVIGRTVTITKVAEGTVTITVKAAGTANYVAVSATATVKLEVVTLYVLSAIRYKLAAAHVGNYALFGGGISRSTASSVVDAYNTDLVRSTATALSDARCQLGATHVGNYAIFGGGAKSASDGGSNTVVDAYNASLTRSTPTALSSGRAMLGATHVGNYALFGGGRPSNTASAGSTVVDAYNTSLTRSTPTALSIGRYDPAATYVGNYALFGGGMYWNTSAPGDRTRNTVNAYDTGLTRSTPTALSTSRATFAATHIGNYALFGGGYTITGSSSSNVKSSYSSVVDAYNTGLTRSTPTALSAARRRLAATHVGNYALFGGGHGSSVSAVVDAYNTSLTRSTPTAFSTARLELAATYVGNYALFGGGTTGSTGSSGKTSAATEAYDTSLVRIVGK